MENSKYLYRFAFFSVCITAFGLFRPVVYARETVTYTQNTVKICDDGAEWPPYMFYKREGKKVDRKILVGATKELMDRIFAMAHISYTVTLLPWKRCLQEVTRGIQYQIVTDASSNKNRLKHYLRSKAIYATISGMFYSKKKFPDGIKAKTAKDLNQYRLCGVLGYNYDSEIALGIKQNNIDTGAKGDKNVIGKLILGRCDIVLGSIEPILGGAMTYQFLLPDYIGNSPLPGAKSIKFYLWVSKKATGAKKLLAIINANIEKLQASGEAEKIFRKYLPGGSQLAR